MANTLEDLLMQGNQSSGLERLAQMFIMNQAQRQAQPQQPRTVNIGGTNILDVTPRNGLNAINESVMPGLAQLAQGYLMNQQMDKRQQFNKELGYVLTNTQDPEEQIKGIMQVGAKYGGFMGQEDKIKQYIDVLSKQQTVPVGIINPLTGEVTNTGQVQRGGRYVKGILTPEQIRDRASAEGEAKAISKNIETSDKLNTAVKRLAILNKQYNEAFPTGDRTPLEQRIVGGFQSWAVKKGLVNNPKFLALQKNMRPIAINMIRLFGEVGNLSESEQQGALDVVNQAGLTEKERLATTRQFIEYALQGASPEAMEFIRKRKDIQGILESFGVDLKTAPSTQSEIGQTDIRAQYNALRSQGVPAQEAKKRLGL